MATEKSWLKPLLVLVAVIIGMSSAAQSRVNGFLGGALGSGYHAAAISFGVGTLILFVWLAVSPSMRAGLGRMFRGYRDRSLPWWTALVGLCGAAHVLAQGIVVPILGVSVLMTAVVVGQMVGSLAIDHFGWMGTPRQPASGLRLVGAVIAVIAVGVIGVNAGIAWQSVGFMLFGFVAGVLQAVQFGITGTARTVAQEPMAPTLVNFFFGLVFLLVVAVVTAATGIVELGPFPTEWWMYLGGAIGVFYIAMIAVVVRGIGVFLLALSIVCGQLIGSLVFDLLVGIADWVMVLGVVLALLGVLIAQFGARPKTT